MDNRSTRVDKIPASLWQKALDLSASAILVYELVKPDDGSLPRYLIQLANRRAEQMTGFSQNELVGRFANELFPDTSEHLTWSDIEHVVCTGESIRREFFYHFSRSGVAAWFDVSVEPTEDRRSVVVSFSDISEWKKKQQSLLSDSILFRALSSTVPEMGVVAIDFFRKIALANGSVPGLFKSTDADELIGRRFLDSIGHEFINDWQQYITTAFDGEQHHFTENWDGSRCEVYVGPVRNSEGHIVMVLAVYKNVSEQYQQQVALQLANVSLHQSNESLERFAYVASHDLQEPLRKIRAFGELINVRYADQLDDMGRDMIGRMQSAAVRMDDLIRSLLSFSRINTPVLKPESVNLNELFVGIQADLELITQEKNALVTIVSPLPTVPGDETQLRQLFQNLLTNALKFVAPGVEPQVTISACIVGGIDAPHHQEPTRLSQTQYAEIRVADNGIGIAEANLDAIFGLFTRLHSRVTYAGTGIGLATTKRVAENHGGTITVESEEGKGTTFRVYLPVAGF